MNIAAAMEQVKTIQSGLAIASPVAMEVKQAWKYLPDQKAALIPPTWVNSWSMPSTTRQLGNWSLFWTVHMQLFAVPGSVQDDRAMEICSQFMTEVLEAFAASANRTLSGTVSRHSLRGGDPTIGRMSWGEQSYMGLDLYLDLQMEEARP